jgi:dipeptidyl aminopeptidase/acylaminoacyl peptidase
MTMTRRRALAVTAGLISMCTPICVGAQARVEIHQVETLTVSAQRFLLGQNSGRPITIGGELSLPTTAGEDKLPALILLHGGGGLSALNVRWVRELNGLGVATLLLDSFTGRDIVNTINDGSQLDSIAMMIDAFNALEMLAQDPRIEASRIAVMGFSKRMRAMSGFG